MRLIRALVLAALLVLVWPAGSASAAGQHVQVSMANFAFAPASLTIHAGDAVTWTNHDTAPHDVTVTSGPVSLHSPMLSTGQSWSYTFSATGTYSYVCSIHPDMHATLTVLAAPAPQSATTHPAAAAPTVAVTTPAQPAPVATAATHPTGSTHPAKAAATPPATTTTSAAAVPVSAASPSSTTHTLKPLLLVAGLVAAIATLCLLLLASRSDDAPTT